ncbi:hypothetical protein K8R03_02800 [Candidatus Kaiserbacteria bacterium]|nr:hypothetical protein [Candidatus Kaiserbacteria bacterium]
MTERRLVRTSAYFAITLLTVCGALLSVTERASAHVVGLSWTATTSPYVIDIGYDPNEFQVGLSARFDFQLLEEKNSDITAYDHVWVRLVRNEKTLLATGIRQQQLGPTTLLYSFLDAGTYKIEASFRDKEGNDMAVASFPFSISSSGSGGSVLPSTGIFLGGALMGALAFFIWKGRKR